MNKAGAGRAAYPRLAENIYLSDDGKSVVILDQTALPGEEVYLQLQTAEEMFDAIKALKVRGAPAIGIFAGYCMYVLARRIREELRSSGGVVFAEFAERLASYSDYLNSSRPTAVNLSRALAQIDGIVQKNKRRKVDEIIAMIGDEAKRIQEEDIKMCRKIAENGLTLIGDGDGILTHCNAGPLATSRYGTALGPVLLGHDQGMEFHVFADETRPLLQGARLTAYELQKAGVDVTLICDNMAATVMKNGWVRAVMVGCDRVAANGDTANKIGTSGLAVLAQYYGIPFYVLGPGSTIDVDCPTGDGITIELRDPDEIRAGIRVRNAAGEDGPAAPADVACYNPAFDVTDHSLITAIVTEKGICYPPFDQSLKEMFGEENR